jgi:putative transposase
MKFVRLCKGRSSRLLRQEFPALKSRLPTLWTNSTFLSTVGVAPLSVVKQYIESQMRSEPRPKKTSDTEKFNG